MLRQAEGHPLANLINSLMVRSMRQAVYSPVSQGHFGIATRFYSHFTSPIRRYPDLMTHRAIKALLEGRKENHATPTLEKAGVHCSERERAASDAEHKSVDVMRGELMKDLVGTVMDGAVTTVIESGAFVMLGDSGAEGLLRVNGLKPGAKVRVMLASVDSATGKMELSLEGGRPQQQAQPGGGQSTAGRDRWKVSNRGRGNGGGGSSRGRGRGRSRGGR